MRLIHHRPSFRAALRELACLEDNRVAIREAGGIPITVAMLSSASEEEARPSTSPKPAHKEIVSSDPIWLSSIYLPFPSETHLTTRCRPTNTPQPSPESRLLLVPPLRATHPPEPF